MAIATTFRTFYLAYENAVFKRITAVIFLNPMAIFPIISVVSIILVIIATIVIGRRCRLSSRV